MRRHPTDGAPELAKAREATQDPEPDEGVLGVRRGNAVSAIRPGV